MVDSSSWTIPASESGGCQVGILEEFFLEAKTKWPCDNCKIGFGTISSLVSHLETQFYIYPYVFRVKESNNDQVKVVCMTHFQDGRHKICKVTFVMQSFHF